MLIMVGADESEAGRHALRWALGIGTRAGARIEAVRSWTYTPTLLRQLASHEAMDRHTASGLREMVAEEAGAANEVRKTVLRGPAHYALLALIHRRRPFFVVVGRRGDERITPRVMGSVSRRLVAAAPCPLVVVSSDDVPTRPDAFDEPVILVGYDGSAHAERALEWATELAAETGGRLLVARILGFAAMDAAVNLHDEAERELADLAFRVTDKGVRCDGVVAWGDPRQELERIADEHQADLLVIGPRGEGALTKIVLGTVASYLTEHADRPVAIVPPATEEP